MPALTRDHFLDKDFPIDDFAPKEHRLQLLKRLLPRDIAVLRCRPLAPERFNAAVQLFAPRARLRLDTCANNIAHDTAASCTRDVAVALQVSRPRLDEIALRLVRVFCILIDGHPAVVKARHLARLIGTQTFGVKGAFARPLWRDCRDCFF